jgi:hypothetical protein
MEITEIDKGKIVELSLKPEWGRGKIVQIKLGKATIVFENDPEHLKREYSLYSEFLKKSTNQDGTGFKGRAKKKVAVVKKYPTS